MASKRKRTSKRYRRKAKRRRKSRAPPRTGGFYGPGVPRGVVEKKYIDSNISGTLTSTYNSYLLNGIAAGTGANQRIGRKIVMTSLFFRWRIGVDLNSGTNYLNSVPGDARLVIVYDSQANGTAPTWTDVFTNASPVALMNMANRDRFKVLFDKMVFLGGTVKFQLASTSAEFQPIGPVLAGGKKYRKLYLETIQQGDADTISSISTGSVYAMWIGSTADTCNGMRMQARIRYIDS